MKLDTDVHVHHWMTCNDFGDPLTLPLVLSPGKNSIHPIFCDVNIPAKLHFPSASTVLGTFISTEMVNIVDIIPANINLLESAL